MEEIKKPNEQECDEKFDSPESEEFDFSNSIKEALKDLPEALGFIQRLQECILRQRTLIHRLYNKLKEVSIKKKNVMKDVSTQTCGEIYPEECAAITESGNIVEDIKIAAENAVQQTGFVYETTSGMYYDYNTGYYYDAELALYYDGQSGIYYSFDNATKSFQFHSQVVMESSKNSKTSSEDESRKRDLHELESVKIPVPKKIKTEIKEEGECSESSCESDSEINEVTNCDVISACDTSKNNVDVQDCELKTNIAQNILLDDEVASAWPPCLRIVVKETGLEKLLVGSLFIVTCTGGTLGREGDHAVFIPDINISKHHAKVSFNEEEKCYTIVDLGSRNGTFVDGRRISVALQESEPVALLHRTMVRVGSTRLECHLHQGRDTCTDCEPGCALQKQTDNAEVTNKDHTTKEARHRSELRRLRKRFGLDKLNAKEASPSLAPGYQDRAEDRRKTVGSQDHHAKTETASVHKSIQNDNKGYKMLSKMGWAQGQSLGKDSTKGVTEPVLVEQRPDKAGLGAEGLHLPTPDPQAKKKAELWKKAQKRFQELDE